MRCHSLIPKPALPFGLLEREPQHEQVWVVYASLTSSNHTHAFSHLYLSMVLSVVQLASNTDLANLVRASALAFTLPTKIAATLKRLGKFTRYVSIFLDLIELKQKLCTKWMRILINIGRAAHIWT